MARAHRQTPGNSSRPVLGDVAGGLALWLFAGGALAQPVLIVEPEPKVYIRADRPAETDADAPARLTRLIDELGSPDFKARAQADRALFDDAGISLPMIERAIKEQGPDLSIDTRLRLTSAARARFEQTPRAAMGIQFWQNGNLRDRVVIERTFPRFDAADKIEDGDMIVEADGVPLIGPMARIRFQSVIVSHDPGDSVPITIRRGERKINVSVRLGRREDLENNAFVDPGMLERAWRVRSASYVSPVTDPIRPPIKGAEWSVNPLGGMGQFERLTARQKGAIGLGPSLAGGGMPRGTGLGEDPYGQRLTTGNLRRNGQIIINNMVWFNAQFDPMQEPNLPALTPQQELDELARARAQAASSLERARPGAGGGGGGGGAGGRRLAPEGQFMVLRDFVAKDVAIIDKQIASIRAEMTEAGIPIREPQPDPLAPEAQAKPPAPAQEP